MIITYEYSWVSPNNVIVRGNVWKYGEIIFQTNWCNTKDECDAEIENA